jgi:dihydroorotase
VFESQNALDKLEGFASIFGADFYGLPHNTETIILKKQDWIVPDSYPFADATVVPFMAGKTMDWKLIS